MDKFFIFVILIFSFCLSADGQKDTLVDLGFNKKLVQYSTTEDYQIFKTGKGNTTSKKALALPFVDDFSQQHFYPNASKWMDNNVYINTNYAVNPISYGVATFDGLDSTGYPYDFLNPTSWGVADYLTSKTIDLTVVTDSVFLSFYYQPKGIGNQPEPKDSLRLEFFRKSDSTWVRQWAVIGSALAPFKKVMIPVDTSFQNDAFQFRFKNFATLSGNVDHWNLDYVYLNDNRNHADTALNDVALTRDFYNMLNEFTAMPYTHYKLDSIGNMATSIAVEYKNNSDTLRNVYYKYEVFDDGGAGASIEEYPTGTSTQDVDPYSSKLISHAVYNLPLNDFYFPVDDTAKTKVYQIKNYFNLTNGSITDFNQNNDTVYSYQVFGNYYAYDDGSAEAGYGVFGIGSKVANQFNIKLSDTLVALDIYFNPVTYIQSAKSFRLKIWSSLSPEVVVYQQSSYYNPIYSFTNELVTFNLDYPIYLPAGTYYFGYENITEDFLTTGYDLNNDNSNRIFMNTEGIWENSNYAGSLMIHPVFKYDEVVVNVNELAEKNTNTLIYPNPSTGIVYLNSNSPLQVVVFDVSGKKIVELPKGIYNKIDLSVLSNGIYFLNIYNNNQSQIEKIIISK
ncbi:MAG: T9SS type A sorting domain-containing protein [Bacteroidetes bacterium]|nr:T9SS type A sorting domain-containing protein [Bacteroidota bacterium]